MPKRNAHLLSLYECESGIVIAQEAVKDKENEITASAALLHPCLVKGRIITADAMHTQKKFCTTVYAVMSSQAEEEDIPDTLNKHGSAEAPHAEIHIRVITPSPRTPIPPSQSVFLFNEHLTDSQEFYGRKRERASFIERCRKGASTSIIGPRRIGKTWLLEYLLLEASTLLGHKYRVGYLDATMPKCRSVSGFVAIALEQLGSPKQALLSLEALEEAVEKLKQHHLSPILCIDEFEGFTNKQEFDVHFFSGLRAISHNGLALVIASKKTLFQVVGNDGDTSGFFNIFETFILKPFDEKEAKSFLMEKGGQAKFTEQEQLHLLKYSQMQGRSEWLPLRLQLAGKMLLEDRDQDSYIPDDVHYWWNFKERLEEQYSTVVVST